MLTLKTNINQFKPKRTDGKKFKVLLNAGGGAFGYIITNLMSSLDFNLYEKIDIAAGTSIGGILTLLYVVDGDYKKINQLFETGVEEIFERRFFGGINGPLYDNDNLKKFMCKILKDYTLADIDKLNKKPIKVIIPTLDYNLTQPRIFDNIDLDPLLDIPLWKIGLATAAAPTYFPAIEYVWRITGKLSEQELKQRPVNQQIYLLTKQLMEYQQKQKEALIENPIINKSTLIDGGVIQNIPVITTYTSLRSELGISPQDIDMFIIGTGDDFTPKNITAEQMNKWSYLDWLNKFLIPYVTESNESTSVYWGALMGFNSFCYFNPLKTQGRMDDPDIIPILKKQCEQIRQDFKKELNQFIQK